MVINTKDISRNTESIHNIMPRSLLSKIRYNSCHTKRVDSIIVIKILVMMSVFIFSEQSLLCNSSFCNFEIFF